MYWRYKFDLTGHNNCVSLERNKQGKWEITGFHMILPYRDVTPKLQLCYKVKIRSLIQSVDLDQNTSKFLSVFHHDRLYVLLSFNTQCYFYPLYM